MTRVCRWIAGLGLVAAALHAAPVSAEPSAADKETSRNLFSEGTKALEAADFARAERACGGAYKLVNAPRGALCWGRALEGLGRLVEARDAYLAAARYPSKDDEPSVFTSAREEGKGGADRLEKRIATVVLNISGASESSPLRVAIDGSEIVGDTARLPRKVNPGRHVVLVASPGFHTARVELFAGEGQEQRVDVQLRPALPGESTEQEATTTHAQSSGPSPLAYVAIGVGVAGLVVGSLFGALALSDSSWLKGVCTTGASNCPSSAQSRVDSLHSHELWSDVGLGVGVVGIGVGAVLLLMPRSTDAAPSSVSVQVDVAPRFVGVRGRF
jgi:hypothetical protein